MFAPPRHPGGSAPPASVAWHSDLSARAGTDQSAAVHLAIFVEPYLRLILEGVKTLESRFSKNRCPPYGRVHTGDYLLLKRSGGPVLGLCRVACVWSYQLDPERCREIRATFAEGLCAREESFWAAREGAAFATIMELTDVRPLDPFTCEKRDRRGWVVVDDGRQQPSLL